MAIDLEGRTVQGIGAFAVMVVLNLLYLLACVPLVTAGAATSALLEVMLRYADHERGRPLVDFLRALRANLLRATAVHLALGVPVLALLFAARFWFTVGGALSLAGTLMAVLMALYLLGALLHGLALVAAVDEPVRATLRNALLLPGGEPLRTAGLVLIPAGMIALALVVPGAGWLLLTIGASAGGYLAALLLRASYRRLGALA